MRRSPGSPSRPVLLALALLLPAGTALAQAVTPTLVQHKGSTVLLRTRGLHGNHFKFTPPNPVLPGNCLVLGVAYTSGASFAATPVTDSNGNVWPAAPAAQVSDAHGTMDLAVFVLPGARPGPTTITFHFAAPVDQVQYSLSEFAGIATVAPLAGSSGASAVQAPNLSAGSFTPANNDAAGGNLVWSTFFDDSNLGSGNEVVRFTPGPGFSLLDADIGWHHDPNVHHAAQWGVQAHAAPIAPSMTAAMSPGHDTFIGLAIALRAAPAGTPPPPPSAGIRIQRILHNTHEVPPPVLTAQAPSSGNLIVVNTTDASDWADILSITDNKGNTYTKLQPDPSEPQFFVAANAVTGNDLLLTLQVAQPAVGMSFSIFDIAGAAAQPIGAVGAMPAVDCSNVTHVPGGPVITPTGDGLTIAAMSLGQGPGLGLAAGAPAGAVFDLVTYEGETDLDTMENADCRAHVTNVGSRATQSFDWIITAIPNNSAAATAVHLLAATQGQTAPAGEVRSAPAVGTGQAALGALALLAAGAAVLARRRRQEG